MNYTGFWFLDSGRWFQDPKMVGCVLNYKINSECRQHSPGIKPPETSIQLLIHNSVKNEPQKKEEYVGAGDNKPHRAFFFAGIVMDSANQQKPVGNLEEVE